MNLAIPFIIVFPSIGILIMVVSVLVLINESFLISFIKLNNRMQGVQTKITPTTLKMAKISAVAAIVGAILLLLFFLNIFLPEALQYPEHFEFR